MRWSCRSGFYNEGKNEPSPLGGEGTGRASVFDRYQGRSADGYQRVLCVSPEYLARRGTPAHPRELVDHDCIVFLPGGTTWSFESARGPVNVNVRPHLTANDTRMLLDAARDGHGFTIVSGFSAQAGVDAGELVLALPDFPVPELWAKALIPESRIGLARIDALLRWLTAAMAPPPWERGADQTGAVSGASS